MISYAILCIVEYIAKKFLQGSEQHLFLNTSEGSVCGKHGFDAVMASQPIGRAIPFSPSACCYPWAQTKLVAHLPYADKNNL